MKIAVPIALSSLISVGAFQLSRTRTRDSLPWKSYRCSKPGSSSTCLFADVEPLATEGDWQAYLDEETTGLIYYFNSQSGQSLWEPPSSTFPPIKLPRRKQRIASKLRTEYRQARQAELEGTVVADTSDEKVEETGDGSGWIGGLFEQEQKEEPESSAVTSEPEEQVPTTEEEGGGWLGGMFAGGIASVSEGIASVTKQSVPEEGAEPSEPVVEQPLVESEPVEAAKPRGIFDAFTSKVVEGQPRVKEPVVDAPKEPSSSVDESSPKDKGGSFFDNIFSLGNTQTKEPETPVVEKKVEPSKAPKKKQVTKRKTLLIPQPKEIKVTKAAPKQKVRRKTMLIPPEERPGPVKIDTAAYVLPHPAKMLWGGEDAVFTKGRTFGVFDGVTGADKLDGVPLYSKTLANKMRTLVGTGNEGLTVQALSSKLTEAAEYADLSATGASTALVASIAEDGFLRVLNLGDSCCIVIRDGKLKAKSREISHYFECPYQLAEDSPDRPKDGTKLNVELLAGDLVIMGSDGVFDNLSDGQILELVDGLPRRSSLIAKKVVDASRKASLNPKAETPYAKLAKRRGDRAYADGLGGKLDDSSCVVAICK